MICEAHMRELDLQERRLKLEEDQLQHEQWERRNAEPVFANVHCNEIAHDVPLVYAREEVNVQAEPDLYVMQPATLQRVLKPHEL